MGEHNCYGKNITGLILQEATWKSKLEIEAGGDDVVQAINGIKEFFDQESVSASLAQRGF